MSQPDPVELVQSEYSHYIIIGCSVFGLVWGGINAMFVSNLFASNSILVELACHIHTMDLVLTLLFAHVQVNKVELDATNIKVKNKETDTKGMKQAEIDLFPWTREECKERMETINKYIKEVSLSFQHPVSQIQFSVAFSNALLAIQTLL